MRPFRLRAGRVESIDPDEVRDVACDATAGDAICRVPEPREIDPTDFTDAPAATGGGGGALGLVLVVVMVVVIVLAVAWLARAWFEGRTSNDEAHDEGELDDDLDQEVDARVVDHETPPDRWRRLAAEHRADGRFRDAIRCEYRALVGDLARAGFVDEIPGRTSGEEREQIASLAPSMQADFDVAADLFDGAWFDDDDVTSEHDARFRRASGAVLGVVGAR